MNLHNWEAFAFTTFLICFSPGPNMLHMLTSSARYGVRRTCFSMAGCFLAVSGMIAISVAGIGALLQASPHIFNLLRYAGGAYLLYLGVQSWRGPVAASASAGIAVSPAMVSPAGRTLFRNGFLVGISNPKALLFAGAFLPQFMDPSLPTQQQLIVLFITFTIIELGCYTIYALGGQKLAGFLSRTRVRRYFNRLTGCLFALFAFLLLWQPL